MKTIHQFTMNRQFFKIILDLVHTRYQIYSNKIFACLRACMLAAYLLQNGWTDLAKLFFVSSVLVARWI